MPPSYLPGQRKLQIIQYRQVSFDHSIYRSIAIPRSIDIECSQVSRYFDISSIEPALIWTSSFIVVDIIQPFNFPVCTKRGHAGVQ